MKMDNEEQKKISNRETSDEADEKFWQNFSRDLWLLFKKAEDLPTTENANLSTDKTDETTESAGRENTRNLRENCLTFTRCDEIGKRRNAASGAEKTHLEHCRFCARRVERFGVNSPPMPSREAAIEKQTAILPPSLPPKKSFWARLFPPTGGNLKTNRLRLSFGLAGLALIFFAGLTLLVWRGNLNQPTEVSVLPPSASSPVPDFNAAETASNKNSNAADSTPTNSGANIAPPTNRKETANENAPENSNSDESAINLAALPSAVRESLATGSILPSPDLARLRNVPTRRAGGENFTSPVSPKNEATFASAPVFRWRSAADFEYQINITDDAGREVAKSAVLSQNSWQIESKLPAGFYFWRVAARRKGVAEFTENSSRAMFKVLSEPEKRELETVKSSVKSNLVNAILYARAGLLAEAERELNIELRRNPNSSKARKMLAQVRNWRRH